MSFWDILWLLVWSFFFISYLMVLFHVITDVLRDASSSGWIKALWIVLLLVLPAITAVIYLIVRGQGMTERTLARAAQGEQATREYIRDVAGTSSPAAEIASAKRLLDEGVVTQEEFEALKARALA